MTEDRTTISFSIEERNQVGEARRLATGMAAGLQFPEEEIGKVSLVVTEMANNLVKHAQGGELLITPVTRTGVAGIEILSLDRGPGMADVQRCLEDGFSTAGSPGTGLGAMARLAPLFDLYTRPQSGTGILAHLWSNSPPPAEPRLPVQAGGLAVAMQGEHVCGDAWEVLQTANRTVLLIADGLGHGPFAAEAADEAVRIFREVSEQTPAEIIDCIHRALRSTRGAAVAVAEIAGGELRYAGIGNIAASIAGNHTIRNLISYNGIVGHQARKIQEMTYPWPPDGLLVMNSDGLKTRWSLDHLPGLELHHPSLIAGMLYRDFKRERDDVTVVVCRGIV